MKTFLLALAVLALITSGCSITISAGPAGPTPTAAPPQATFTSYPTQVPPTLYPTLEPPTDTPYPTLAQPTDTPYPTATSVPSCMRPEDVTLDDVGRTVTICGKVSEVGSIPCPSCEYGAMSYMMFGSRTGLQVYSYDWRFLPHWANSCVRITDEVKRLGSRPVFVFEGFGNVASCTIDNNGVKTCKGNYIDQYACPVANSSSSAS